VKNITHALLGFVAGTGIACSGVKKPKPIHVPLVAYYAHINDKDCKRIGKDNPPRFRCNNVLLDPKEIDATGRK
jgi:hypothetical protein